MLNAGFSTLDYLKSRLLPEAAREDTTWDEALGKLGLAIASRFEAHCNREFSRTVDGTHVVSARSLVVSVKRYPVEAVTAVEILATDDGATAVDAATYTLEMASGLLEFFTPPGDRTQRIRVTYTGGFWLDPLDGTTTKPEAATALPDDLLEAWLAEVQLHAEERGTFEAIGLRARKESEKVKLTNGLSENTAGMLRTYRRFSGE